MVREAPERVVNQVLIFLSRLFYECGMDLPEARELIIIMRLKKESWEILYFHEHNLMLKLATTIFGAKSVNSMDFQLQTL